MTSFATNWGKAVLPSVLLRGVMPDGVAAPSAWYVRLLNGSFPWGSPNPDLRLLSDYAAWLVDDEEYVVTSLPRLDAFGSYLWAVTVDDANDRGVLARDETILVPARASAAFACSGFAVVSNLSFTQAEVIACLALTETKNVVGGDFLSLTAETL